MKPRVGTAVTSVVTFEVGGVLYALDIQRVREIIKPLPVHRLPHMPETVVGVADHRGDVVPVVDLRMRFGLATEDASEHGRWIIVRRGARLVAFVVDRVVEVSDTSKLEPRETPELGHGDDVRGIVAAHARAGKLVFVVDAETLASAALGLDTQLLRLPAVEPVGDHGGR
jgi:purine-binding chemotaxis protein CheW